MNAACKVVLWEGSELKQAWVFDWQVGVRTGQPARGVSRSVKMATICSQSLGKQDAFLLIHPLRARSTLSLEALLLGQT